MALHLKSTGVDFYDFTGSGTDELLGDYEYGTYTPAFTPISSGSITVGAGFRYIQIGVMVTVSGRSECSGSSSPAGGYVKVSVPLSKLYTPAATSVGSCMCVSEDSSNSWNIVPLVSWGNDLPYMYDVTVANISNSWRFQPHLNYQAAMS